MHEALFERATGKKGKASQQMEMQPTEEEGEWKDVTHRSRKIRVERGGNKGTFPALRSLKCGICQEEVVAADVSKATFARRPGIHSVACIYRLSICES